MNMIRSSLIPSICAAAGLVAFAVVLTRAINSFHASVDDWAARDLAGQTELAARMLGEHYGIGDIERIRAFGEERRAEGMRLTLFGRTGKPIYDSHVAVLNNHSDRPEIEIARKTRRGTALRKSASTGENTLYCAYDAGGFIVRLAIPYDGLIEPVRRAHAGLLLAGFAGACGVMFVFLFTNRLAERNRALARERDEKTRRLAEMERRETFRRDFVANVTHEIKTPVTGIMAAADMLSDASTPASDRTTLLDLLKRESRRLDALAHDVLDLARLEHERPEDICQFAPTDLSDILESVRANLQPRADAAGIRLVVNSPSPLPFVCDAALIEQALSNLVENAIKYSHSPDIILSAKPSPPHPPKPSNHQTIKPSNLPATLSVEDHGAGIPEEHRARIFERFYRVDKDRSRAGGGTGLGLAIVKHIARLHGGEATLVCPPSGGCRFEIVLAAQRHQDQK